LRRLGPNVSRPVFARYLNTSESTVETWKTGAKRISSMVARSNPRMKPTGSDCVASRVVGSSSVM
jgi:hypothetical protein